MKIGIKTYAYQNGIEFFKDKADFIEVMAIEGQNYSFLKGLSLPVVVHVAHHSFGVNFADKTKKDLNTRLIKHAIKLADLVNSKKIIIHMGAISNSDSSEGNAISFLKSFGDKRFLIENLPPYSPLFGRALCSTHESLKNASEILGVGICFDLNHAISCSLENREDYFDLIKRFLELKPAHYHLGGQRITGGDKTHLSLSESEIDIKKILAILPRDAEITLEVSSDLERVKKDLELMKDLIKHKNF